MAGIRGGVAVIGSVVAALTMLSDGARTDFEPTVWPIPSTMDCDPPGRSGPATLAPGWAISVADNLKGNTIVQEAVARYTPIIAQSETKGLYSSIKNLTIAVTDPSDTPLHRQTNYSYSVTLGGASAVMVAHAQWGVAYALETVSQLLDAPSCNSVTITDTPRFPHRGIMIDTGRRFYPVPLVKSILDGMAAVKMNVLHFHLSEECFRVASTSYPALTASCRSGSMTNNEVYSQDDVTELVGYARSRGIRVVPEFDMPGHSGGFCTNLASAGIQCCGSQIEDDPEGKSAEIIQTILTEMAGLFPDEVMNIGCDETGSKAPCTTNNTKSFEVKMIQHLLKIGKQPMGWEEILFKTGAAADFPTVIVDSWARTSWSQAASQGHPVVDSRVSPFYLDYPGHTAASMWLDLTDNNTDPKQVALLLGGEVSMWSDKYVGSCMFQSPQADANFSLSTAGCIWPRSIVAAGTFWGYHPDVSAADPAFNESFALMQRRFASRGISACPCATLFTNGCSQEGRCGVGFCSNIPPPPGPPAPAADVYRCANSSEMTGDFECHNAWDGAPELAIKGGPATVSCDSPYLCAVEASNTCHSLTGCAVFSLAATEAVSDSGSIVQAVAFYKAAPPSPNPPETGLVWGVACNENDPAQNFTVDPLKSTVTHNGLCLDAKQSSQLSLQPCDGSPEQKFVHQPTGTLNNPKGCVDMYFGGAGPNVGLYHCDQDWNQVWTASSPTIVQNTLEEVDDGRCMSAAQTGYPGLVYNGKRGAGKTNVWTPAMTPHN